MTEEQDQYLSIRELGIRYEAQGFTRETFRAAIRAKQLPALLFVGRQGYRVRLGDAESFVTARLEAAAEAVKGVQR